jgi:hypothetical protein
LLMVILISRWFRTFNTMVRRLFYGWFISNSRTYTNSLRNGVRYKTFWLCQRKLILNAAADNLLFVPRAWCAQRNCYCTTYWKGIRLKEVFKADEILR